MIYNESRRDFLRISSTAILSATLHGKSVARFFPNEQRKQLQFYAGTYTDTGGKGIYHGSADVEKATAGLEPFASEIKNPSFLILDRDRRFLFAVSETPEYEGHASGGVYAYAIHPLDGTLTLINHRSSEGTGPCHIALDRTNQFLLVANYDGGNVAVFPRGHDGAIGPVSDFIQHKGSGPVKDRQQSPHAHCVLLDPSNRFAIVADLGMDKLMVYSFDAQKGTLTPAPHPFLSLPEGSGPRHVVFHPDGKFAYIIAELNSTVITAAYDGTKGEFRIVQSVSTLPADYSGVSAAAELFVSPSGRFVYCSNRGHNSIAVFAIHSTSGTLRLVQHQSQGINWPRNFVIDPTGRSMLVANQRSNSIVLFSVDQAKGTLSSADLTMSIPSPACVQCIPTA